MYWIKASGIVFLLSWIGIIVLLDFVCCFATPWWCLDLLLSLHYPADCLDMVGLATTATHLAICKILPLGVPCTAIFAVHYHPFLTLDNIVMCLLISDSNSVASLILSSTSFCALYCSIPWTHINNWLLGNTSVSVKAVNSLIISSTMTSSFKPLIDCSVSLLSYSLYL